MRGIKGEKMVRNRKGGERGFGLGQLKRDKGGEKRRNKRERVFWQ